MIPDSGQNRKCEPASTQSSLFKGQQKRLGKRPRRSLGSSSLARFFVASLHLSLSLLLFSLFLALSTSHPTDAPAAVSVSDPARTATEPERRASETARRGDEKRATRIADATGDEEVVAALQVVALLLEESEVAAAGSGARREASMVSFFVLVVVETKKKGKRGRR